jgi:hypothetical protein
LEFGGREQKNHRLFGYFLGIITEALPEAD